MNVFCKAVKAWGKAMKRKRGASVQEKNVSVWSFEVREEKEERGMEASIDNAGWTGC
jgi:hypothetical protein